MMFVSALVMQPCQRDAGFAALGIIRAFESLIVLCSAPEFHRAVFAEIVLQPLCNKPETKAVSANEMPMLGDGYEMCDRMHYSAV